MLNNTTRDRIPAAMRATNKITPVVMAAHSPGDIRGDIRREPYRSLTSTHMKQIVVRFMGEELNHGEGTQRNECGPSYLLKRKSGVDRPKRTYRRVDEQQPM